MIRSFIAFSLPPEIREMLMGLQERLKRRRLDLRYTRPEGMHLTLKFLGNIREEDIEPIYDVMKTVSKGVPPLEVYLHGVGAFPCSRNPRVVWAGLEGDLVPLYTFQQELEQGLVPLGFEPEHRRFQAHLTLGRIRRNRKRCDLSGILEDLSIDPPRPFKLEEFVLYKSNLLPGGAVYEKLRCIRIGT